MSRMRFIRISPITTASAIGSAPPDSEVPAPRGIDAHAVAVAEAHDGGDLLGGVRQHDRQRQLAVGGQAVGLVGLQAERLGDQAVARQQRAQAGDDGVAAGQDVGLGLGERIITASWKAGLSKYAAAPRGINRRKAPPSPSP